MDVPEVTMQTFKSTPIWPEFLHRFGVHLSQLSCDSLLVASSKIGTLGLGLTLTQDQWHLYQGQNPKRRIYFEPHLFRTLSNLRLDPFLQIVYGHSKLLFSWLASSLRLSLWGVPYSTTFMMCNKLVRTGLSGYSVGLILK